MTKDHYKTVREKYRKEPKAYWDLMAKKYNYSAILVPGDLDTKNTYYNKIQKKALTKVFSKIPKGSRILEIGCGVGRWSIKLAKAGMFVTAVDISQEMINIAKVNAEKDKLKINFLVSPADKIKIKRNCYDYVLSVTVLQHILDDKKRDQSVANLVGSVKSGGEIILLERVGSEVGEFHVKPLDVGGWTRLFRKHGAALKEVHGVDLSPIVGWINKIGAKMKYSGQPLKEFPGTKSLEKTISPKTLAIYSLTLKLATSISKPIDYYLSDLPFLRHKTSHNILIFRKI